MNVRGHSYSPLIPGVGISARMFWREGKEKGGRQITYAWLGLGSFLAVSWYFEVL
jgi:hypothetical protein